MARVKRGVTGRRRHKAVLKLTKGHRGSRHKLYRQAHESLLHALSYSYAHRRERKGDIRRLWILRINAAARSHGISYSRLIHGLKEMGTSVNRKMLAELAIRDPDSFAEVAAQVKDKTAAS